MQLLADALIAGVVRRTHGQSAPPMVLAVALMQVIVVSRLVGTSNEASGSALQIRRAIPQQRFLARQ